MIKFKITGITYLTFLADLKDRYHFKVEQAEDFKLKDSVAVKNLIFEISKEEGKRLIKCYRNKAKRRFNDLGDNPVVVNDIKNFIRKLSEEVE